MSESKHSRIVLGSLVCSLLALACRGGGSGEPVAVKEAPRAPPIVYNLGKNMPVLFPCAGGSCGFTMPQPYSSIYSYATAIMLQRFTQQSLERAHIPFASVDADALGNITLTPNGDATSAGKLAAFSRQHLAFFDDSHGLQAALGVKACQAAAGCWYSVPTGTYAYENQPWYLYLPLGLPLTEHRGVLFLDYPPAASLMQGDYLANNTMARWARLLAAIGVDKPTLYETIVDSRPIAAPGSLAKAPMPLPDASTYFNTQTAGAGGYYITPMLQLLTDPPSNAAPSSTLPVAILGGSDGAHPSGARPVWEQIIGQTGLGVNTVGYQAIGNAQKSTPWVVGNHPIMAVYQYCAKDPACKNPTMDGNLVAVEQQDLTTVCTLARMGADGVTSKVEATKIVQDCALEWGPTGPNQHTICVQAKLDEANTVAQCPSAALADSWCTAHGDDPCANFGACGDVK